MAYESLKAEIRQYIKTNGQNEITGQILQNVLIDMVNQYPSLDGYATQQWVDNQGFLTDANLEGYATQQWVNSQGFLTNADLSNYATQTWVSNNYLALIGGGTVTASGSDIQMIVRNTGFSWKVNGTTYGSILFSMTEQEGPQVKLDGALIATQTWVTNQGYLTSSSISDMATQTWVGQQGYITSSAISDMATQTWVGQQGYITSLSLGGLSNVSLTAPFGSGQALVYDFQTNKWVNGTLNYLPLTGGTLTDTTTGTPLYIKGRSSSSYIGFKNQQDTVIGYIGMAVGVQDNYPAYYDGSTAYKIWHAGNLTPSDYLAKDGGTMTGDLTISTGHDLILDSGQAYVGKIWNDGNAFTLSSEDSSSNYYDMEFYANDVHFYTNGQVYGDFVNTSDERLKDILAENVLPSVAQVAEAPAIRYRWNNLSKNRNTQEHLGSIAQYWQNVLPTAVVEDKQGYLAMHESTIALLSAISLARKIMELEKEIDDLKKQLN